MNQQSRSVFNFKIYDFRNFSAREALWIAILVHLVVLVLPQSLSPFLLFLEKSVMPRPEPITFRVEQPEELLKEPEKIAAEEEMQAASPENPVEDAESSDPTVAGQTNIKRLETPPPSERSARSAQRLQPPSETGMQLAEPLKHPPLDPEIETQLRDERSEKLSQVLKQPLFKRSDFPIVYRNPKPSKADQIDSIIQFDTYAWEYEPYRDRMIRKLYRFWVPKLEVVSYFRLRFPGLTVFRFTITRDGAVVRLELLQPSGKSPYDQAANHAIIYPYPGLVTGFPPLPPDFPKQTLTVTIAFYVNMKSPDH